MRILKYVPKKLFGFTVNETGDQVYFHIRTFKWGKFPTHPPPLIGEEVEVEYNSESRRDGKAPKAREVVRIHEPAASYGYIESFNVKRGYGFIMSPDGRSHYLHRSEMTDGKLPMPGMEVVFFEGFKQGRPRACFVQITGDRHE